MDLKQVNNTDLFSEMERRVNTAQLGTPQGEGIQGVGNDKFFDEFLRRLRCYDQPQRNIVFIGPPGAGKGSIAPKLTDRFCLCHLSTGDMLRAAVKNRTPIGLKAKDVMDRGELVSDDLILELIQDNMKR